MIILITGASHTGKTLLSQKLLEKYKFPYFSIDHLKMGLIRSKYTSLTTDDDSKLTDYLWPIIKEMIKTAIENNQNLIIEGCYIPYYWKEEFDSHYLKQIHYYCLIMSEEYIKNHFDIIKQYSNKIENRKKDDEFTQEIAIEENKNYLYAVTENDLNYILIKDEYSIENILCFIKL